MYTQPTEQRMTCDLSCSAAAFEAKVSGKDVPKATSEASQFLDKTSQFFGQ
jgi:hypothetical protein